MSTEPMSTETKASRKGPRRKSARERGYVPRSDVAAEFRRIADDLDNPLYPSPATGSLAKYSLNIWFAHDELAGNGDTNAK